MILKRLFLSIFLLLPAPMFALPDGGAERADFVKVYREDFLQGDWQSLAEAIDTAREQESRFLDGTWQLPLLYRAGESPEQVTDYRRWQATMDAWETAEPDSLARTIIEAKELTGEAWDLRGNEPASSVTEAGWAGFKAKLADARAKLEAVPEAERDSPQWYSVMQTVALGQGWSKSEYFELLDQGKSRWPEYHPFYFSAAHFLLPRWYGVSGEWEQFAAAQADASPEGDQLYARIAWSQTNRYRNLFEQTAIEWPRMKAGFQELLKRYPESNWNLNHFAKFALDARDVETVVRLWPELQDQQHPSVWKYANEKQRLAFLLDNGVAPIELQPNVYIDKTGVRPVAIRFLSKDRLLVVQREGGIQLIDVPSRKIMRQVDLEGPLHDAAVSPDGTIIAVAAGSSRKETGRVDLLSASSLLLLNSKTDFDGPVTRVAFDPDNGDLVAAGGRHNKRGEIQVLPFDSSEWREHPAASKRGWNFVAMAPEPGSDRILVDWGTRLVGFDSLDQAEVQWGANVPAFVYDILAPAEGEQIYILRAPGDEVAYGHEKGVIAVNRDNLRKANRQPPAIYSGFHRGILSPDERYLLALDWETNLLTILDLETDRWAIVAMRSLHTLDLAIDPKANTLAVIDRKGGLLFYDWPAFLSRLPWTDQEGESVRDQGEADNTPSEP